MSESRLQKRILDELNANPDVRATKLYPLEVGNPDIVGCYLGRCFLIEVKYGSGTRSKIQKWRAEEWRESGAMVVEAREDFDVELFLWEVMKSV